MNETKTCGKCGQELPLDQFHKGNGTHGRASYCKSCVKKYRAENKQRLNAASTKWRKGNSEYAKDYYAANKEHRQEQNREYAAANREAARERSNRWRKENPERKKQQMAEYYQQNRERELAKSKERHQNNRKANCNRSKKWREDNPARVAANIAKRRADEKQATPNWADLAAIRVTYEEARITTENSGVLHQVDHTIPLNSDVVCGLHCETNLRVITADENNSKNNKLIEDLI